MAPQNSEQPGPVAVLEPGLRKERLAPRTELGAERLQEPQREALEQVLGGASRPAEEEAPRQVYRHPDAAAQHVQSAPMRPQLRAREAPERSCGPLQNPVKRPQPPREEWGTAWFPMPISKAADDRTPTRHSPKARSVA